MTDSENHQRKLSNKPLAPKKKLLGRSLFFVGALGSTTQAVSVDAGGSSAALAEQGVGAGSEERWQSQQSPGNDSVGHWLRQLDLLWILIVGFELQSRLESESRSRQISPAPQ